MKIFQCLMVTGMATALLFGCGSGETSTAPVSPPKLTKLDITLDGYVGPATAGLLLARSRGYFDDLGLEIWIRTPLSRVSPIPYVTEEQVALSISHQPQVVLAREKGAPIGAFGSLVAQPTAALIWLKRSGIGGLADLEGRTIAITGLPFERDFLQALLARVGLTLDDVKVSRADYDLVPDLVDGRVDAILGSGNVEGAQLRARGLEPVVTEVRSLGVPPYDELVLITRSERLAEEPQAIRSFMAALARGTAAAIADPRAAATAIARNTDADPNVTREGVEAQVEATLPILSRSGEIDLDQADELMLWMQKEGMIERQLPVSDLFTNDFLSQP